MDWIDIPKNKKHVTRERNKAKELRKTQWWYNKLQEGICHYCGEKFAPDELTMDHVVPVARGGLSNKRNIVPCCKECNNKKKYLTPVEMLMQQKKDEESNAGDV